jgi:hypothetical protein
MRLSGRKISFRRAVSSGTRTVLRRALFAALLSAAFGAAIVASRGGFVSGPPEVDLPQVRVRIEWGGGEAKVWHGLLEIDRGRFSRPVSLGVETDEPRTIRVDGGAVWIERRSDRVYDGLDVTVHAPGDATLSLTLVSPAHAASKAQATIRLGELDSDVKVLPVGHDGARASIRRTPGDVLGVSVDRKHLIYEPGERFTASVSLKLLDPPSAPQSGKLTWELTKARSRNVLSRATRNIDVASMPSKPHDWPLELPLPRQEGVYDIHVAVSGGGLSAVQSVVQVVVVDPSRRAARPAGSETLVDRFEPGETTFLRRIDPATGGNPWNYAWAKWVELWPQLGEDASTGASDQKANWSAYRLRIAHPGKPHRMVVSFRARPGDQLGVSIVEPNAAGQLVPVGLDTGVIAGRTSMRPSTGPATDKNSARAGTLDAHAKHEVIFWPQIKNPVVLLHDLASGQGADVRSVEVFELDGLPPAEGFVHVTGASPTRLVGAYLHKPILAENFGAGEAYDAESGRSLDDFETFLTAAERLAEYLPHAGYNSLLIAALSDGSTIYPTALLEPTPRYDTGLFFSTGQDPLRKDVLELLFRIFDRAGLVLIPELQFSTPLPAVERTIAQGEPAAEGIELIGRDGRTWREARGSNRGVAPYYNPLHPAVQDAVLQIVEELAERYAHHPSFYGVAVELSSSGYLQFPGLEWGYDEFTVNRFAADTRIQVPAGEGDDTAARRYEFLTGPERREWTAWRSEQLAAFHRRLAKAVSTKAPSARLVLAGGGVLHGQSVYEAFKTGSRPEELLLAKGLNFRHYAQTENMIVLRPSVWQSRGDRLSRVLDETINQSAQLASAFAGRPRGSLFYHGSRDCRIAEFDAASPWQPAYTWLVPPVTAAGIENRKRYAHALAADDAQLVFDGGWLIPMGQEHHTREVRTIVQSLPAVPFHPVDVQKQPVAARIARMAGRTYLYLVNELDGSVDVTLGLQCGPDIEGRVLGTDVTLSMERPAGNRRIVRLSLEPYEIWACELSGTEVRVDRCDASLAGETYANMEERVHRLDRRLAEARSSETRRQPALENPGFELAAGRSEQLPGWQLGVDDAAFWTLDADNPRSGNSSLLLTAGSAGGSKIVSPFLLDQRERVVLLSAWLRSDDEGRSVRLSFEGRVDGSPQVQYADVDVDRRWRRYVFQVQDVPGERMTEARVGIEVQGSGKVWVDDVEVRTLELTEDNLRQLIKLYSAARLAWDDGRYADCQRLLASYWGQYLLDEPAEAAQPEEQPQPSRAARLIDRIWRR